ncbi:MAG: NUDIX hydrolase [Spirochaetales bacterium]|nr:NUDIX hydrolase [Leptospiraceae bacterium]MCP5482491.1 NUDIX hydrolase [Spirochaetales bacterium]MCP5485805.1 NUDIX hydrolase [Spirochaetales bacterium]
MSKPVTPPITADVIIEVSGGVVLIERRNPPKGWAIPGGFVDMGESLEQAAMREAREETGLSVELTALLGIYSDPARDPRGPTVTAVYVGTGSGIPAAGDDAGALRVAQPDDRSVGLAFDHRQILDDYIEFKKTGKRPNPALMLSRLSKH